MFPPAKPPMSQPEIGIPERPRLRTSGMLIWRKAQSEAESPVQRAAYRCIPANPPRANDEVVLIRPEGRESLKGRFQQSQHIGTVDLRCFRILTEEVHHQVQRE